MQKIKIGIVTPTYPPKKGGIATAHYNIYLLLNGLYNVKVFAYNDKKEKNENLIIKRQTPKWLIPLINILAKIYLSRFKHKVDYHNVMRILHCSVGAWLLNRPIREFAPDILIIPDNNVPLYWIRKGKYKTLWVTHNIYLRFRNNPLISNYSWIDIDIAHSMESRAIKKADFILSPSYYMIDEYHKSFKNNYPSFVIHNFIINNEVRKIIESTKDLIQPVFPMIFMPSAGTINKGSRYTFEIIRRVSHYFNNKIEFFISDYIEQDLQYELKYLSKEIIVHTPGHLKWSENIGVLNMSALMVSPTLIENFSNAFVEAFALAKPVITFDVGGNKEIVDDGLNGYVVPYLDVDHLISKTCILLSDQNKLGSFSIEAKNKASKLCNIEALQNQYADMFNKVLLND